MAQMTIRERYRATMRRQPGVRPPLWEFGYWVETVEKWYAEGLQRSPYAPPPGTPGGNGFFAGGLPFPHQPGLVRYLDLDVRVQLGLDLSSVRVPLIWRACPLFTETVLEEDETTRILINADGVKVSVRKDNKSVPRYLGWPVHDRASWEQLKAERFTTDVSTRFPERWDLLAPGYRNRDYPLGVVMDGFFAAPRELIGVEHQLMMYYDDPQLMLDIGEHLLRTWLATLEELLAQLELDFVYVWEDMSFKTGPLLSPGMFERFISPYYQKLTAFLRGRGVETIFVDTDGDCSQLIPLFLRAGVNGMYPFECQAGMDIVKVRQQYPDLLIQGGLDKTRVAEGKAAIDAELEAKLPFLLSQGGYIPFCDHMVPPEVSWEDFRYYRQRVKEYAERYADPN
jgi:uroporphyrinogen-III decarboxylase